MSARLAWRRRGIPEADAAYSRAWRAWLDRFDPPLLPGEEGFEHILAVVVTTEGTRLRAMAGCGLSVLSDQVFRRARALQGDEAVTVEDDEVYLAWPWSESQSALLDAIVVFGEPESVREADREVLAKAWREVFGADPAWAEGSLPSRD